jgi:hypothetical protein
MKVAISVPDPLFRQAESVARRLRIPRSQLYARALEVFLSQQPRPDVTERLNAVYGAAKGEPSDPEWLAAGLDVLRRVEWEDWLVSISRGTLTERVGRIPESLMRQVEDGLRLVVSL